jgi:hypothetical protein
MEAAVKKLRQTEKDADAEWLAALRAKYAALPQDEFVLQVVNAALRAGEDAEETDDSDEESDEEGSEESEDEDEA